MSRLFASGLLACAMTLTACGMSETGVKGAKGDTPVKYVICGVGEQNCFIAARFKDLDSCQSHKNRSGMLCDSRSKPNEMLCRTNPESSAEAYCTL